MLLSCSGLPCISHLLTTNEVNELVPCIKSKGLSWVISTQLKQSDKGESPKGFPRQLVYS